MTATPALGWVRIRSVDPPLTITARLSADRPNIDQGHGGGWTEVARPRRSTLSIWNGQPAYRMSLPILLDRFRDQLSVEREIAWLVRLASPSAADGQPARVRITAKGAAVPGQSRTWVIDGLTWGDAAMTKNGNRSRQQVTLSLLEYIADVRVDSAALRQRQKAAGPKTSQGAAQKRVIAAHGRLTTHPTTAPSSRTSPSGLSATAALSGSPPPTTPFGTGDDLLSIAARELGDANRWVEIAQLNGIRDPRSIVPGQVIRLP